MSKVVLVIEKPSNCIEDCIVDCSQFNAKGTPIPNDCPLRPLPERMTADLYYRKTDYVCDWKERSCGWNECLDEILGET